MEKSCPNAHHDLFTDQKPGVDPELDRRLTFLHPWHSKGNGKFEGGVCTCSNDDGMQPQRASCKTFSLSHFLFFVSHKIVLLYTMLSS